MKNIYGLILSLLLFVIFILLAIVYQSTDYLYMATVLPLVIVPFLPDIKSNQYVKPAKQGNRVQLIKVQGTEPSPHDLLVIAFDPGYLQWNSRTLYFNLDDALLYDSLKSDGFTASITVLNFDLRLHKRKKGWIGVSLKNLAERTTQLSYTTDEINRIVIQMQDLNVLLNIPGTPSTTSASASRSMQG
jgi:hypothetical protein